MAESGPFRVLRFHTFLVDLHTGELRKNGIRLKVPRQPFEILSLLLEHPGEVVTREELCAKLWRDDTFVDFDHSLNVAITKLRDVLSDSADEPRYIQTIPRRGYRFLATVEEVQQVGLVAHAQPPSLSAWAFSWKAMWLSALGLAVLGLGAAFAMRFEFDIGGIRHRFLAKPSATRIQSIAVLPLENLSGDPNQQYFADGMTEELTAELSQIGALRVVSRTSAMRYKGTHKSVPEISRELSVDAVVEGSIKRAGDRVRISAQLIQGPSDTHLWSKSYERDLRDGLGLQSEVARGIVDEIKLKLTPQEQARLAHQEFVDPEAHENYLKGLFQLNKRTGPDARRAITYFDAAIKKEPKYVLAYVALADAYRTLTFNSTSAPADVLPQSEEAAKHALELDDQLAEAHASLAATLADYDWDWTRAEIELQTALRLNPNSWIVHAAYAHVLRQLGDVQNSIREARRSVELDPVNVLGNFFIGQCLYAARHYDQAAAQLRETLDLNPNFWPAHLYLGMTLAQQGRYAEAIDELRKAGDFTAEPHATIGYVYARMGRRADAQKVLADLKERTKRAYVAPCHIANIYIALGDREQAFIWLEKGYRQRDSWLTFLKCDPMYDPIRPDPHFQDLLRRIGLAS